MADGAFSASELLGRPIRTACTCGGGWPIVRPVSDLATNLRRLVFFHHQSAREAARVLGVSEHAVGAWIGGRREATPKNLLRIADVYAVGPSKLAGDPYLFAPLLADPARMRRAEEQIAKARRERLMAVEG